MPVQWRVGPSGHRRATAVVNSVAGMTWGRAQSLSRQICPLPETSRYCLRAQFLGFELITYRMLRMSSDFLIATLFNLGINLVYTIVALVVAVVALLWVDRKMMPSISFEEELRKGNVAVAIFASSLMLFVALIVTFGFKG